MENYAEKNSSSAEKSNGSYAAGQGNPLYDMFVSQLTQLHTVCAKEALARGFGRADLVRSVGETWFVDPQYGRGSYWFYLMDGDTIVVSMSMRCPCIARPSAPHPTASSWGMTGMAAPT